MDQAQENQFVGAPISAERKTIAKFLYRFAWAFEITAVAIGLAISISTMLSSFEEMQSQRASGLKFSDWTNIFIAAVPFVMVAMVEITKIPLVGAFYKTSSRVWSWTFGLVLAFVTLITFESAMNGFERNFSALMYSIDTPKKEMVTVQQRLEKSNEDRTRLTSLTLEIIDQEYNERYEQLFNQTDSQKRKIQDQVNLLRASIQTEHVESLKSNLTAARSDRERLYEERTKALERATDDYRNTASGLTGVIDSEMRSKQRQLLKEQSRLDDMRKEAKDEISAAYLWTKNGVENNWDEKLERQINLVSKLRNDLNSMGATQRLEDMREKEQSLKDQIRGSYARQLQEIDSRIDNLSREISRSIGTKELEIEGNVNQYQEQMTSIDSEFQAQLLIIQGKRDQQYTRLENNVELVDAIDEDIDQYGNREIELVKNINIKVGGNQIYRLATWVANKDSAADVERSTVLIVAAIWFGSLSALIAFMGIFLALASYVIGDDKVPDSGQVKARGQGLELKKFYRAMRRFFVYRKRRVAIKIVEVDKVVFKEIPVEVVKKEFVHIPFYTNDKRLLNLDASSSEDLEGGDLDDKPLN